MYLNKNNNKNIFYAKNAGKIRRFTCVFWKYARNAVYATEKNYALIFA
jgi:hypothetical protein